MTQTFTTKTTRTPFARIDLPTDTTSLPSERLATSAQGKCACYYGTSDGLCGRVSVSGGKKHTADWRTDAGAGANVSAIFFDDRGEDDPAVFGALSNGTIVQLGAIKGNQIETYSALDSASEQSIDGLAVLEDNKYAYVNLGNEVKLVSLAKEKAISTLVPSHQLGVDTVCACLGEKYVLGIGGGSMDVWKVNRRPAAKPVSPAASTPLPLPEAKVRAVGMDRSGSIVGMALDGDGTTKVYLYRLSFKQMKTQCKDESTLLATIDCGAAAVTSLGFAPEGGSVALALESAPGGPNFQVLSFDSETGGQTLALPSTEAAEGDGAQTSGKAKKRKQPEKEQQANGSKDAQQQQQAEPEFIEDDTPLEVRVSQMDIGAKSGANPTQQQPVAVAQAAGANSIKPKQLNADSAVVLLSQALQSNDKELLEQCLQIRQEQVISNTVKQLRSDQVGTLIPLLVDRSVLAESLSPVPVCVATPAPGPYSLTPRFFPFFPLQDQLFQHARHAGGLLDPPCR